MAMYGAIPPECHDEDAELDDEYDLELINLVALGPAYFRLVLRGVNNTTD